MARDLDHSCANGFLIAVPTLGNPSLPAIRDFSVAKSFHKASMQPFLCSSPDKLSQGTSN